MIKRVAVITLFALVSVAAAQPPGFDLDRDARARRLQRDEHVRKAQESFRREMEKFDAKIAEFRADQARDAVKHEANLVKLRDEVKGLAADEERLRAAIVRAEAALSIQREELIAAAVRHCLATARLETMEGWAKPKEPPTEKPKTQP